LPSNEPVIGDFPFVMNTEPEDITANELVVCCKNVDEPDTTKSLPVTVKTLPENLSGTNI
jgi:hypothetical protein